MKRPCFGAILSSMKTLTKTLVFAVLTLVIAVSGLFGQEEKPYCIIKTHPFDMEKARAEISETCKEGYTPVGMEVEDGAVILVMYVKNREENLFSNWALVLLNDFSKLEAEYATMLQAGWLPIAFSYTQSGHYVLFLKTQMIVTGFRIVNDVEDLEAMEKTIKAFAEKGFLPYGMSYFNGRVWYFFLKAPSVKVQFITIRRFKSIDEALGQGVKEAMEHGLVPWNIMVSPDWVYVAFGI